ncbi:MAG: hypothetical protein JKY66_11270 [Spongiibacteraceae bacterium]|nr:hypothetical protein [Spongiibacteraceae bacterium]
MSALTWMRLFGESPVFFVNGEKITFSSKPIPKADGEMFNQVYMHSGSKKGVPITISLEYGEKDWNSAGMAIREWISNALDQGEDIRDDSVVGPANSVRNSKSGVTVFVPMNGEVTKYWSKIGENFLHYSERQDMKLIHKPKIGPLKVYRRGVLIRSFDEDSLYDYNLDFDITENRNGSSDSMMSQIMDTLAYNYDSAVSDTNRIKILDKVLIGERTIETLFDCWTSIGQSWGNMLRTKGGTYIPVNAGEGLGKEGSYVVPEKWHEMIISLVPELDGMKMVTAVEKRGYTTIPATQIVKDNFQKCWDYLDLINMIPEGTLKPSVECFKTEGGKMPNCLAFYAPASGTISIWNDQRASLQSMLEEVSHHITGENDCTRAFQEFLFRSLTETIESF